MWSDKSWANGAGLLQECMPRRRKCICRCICNFTEVSLEGSSLTLSASSTEIVLYVAKNRFDNANDCLKRSILCLLQFGSAWVCRLHDTTKRSTYLSKRDTAEVTLRTRIWLCKTGAEYWIVRRRRQSCFEYASEFRKHSILLVMHSASVHASVTRCTTWKVHMSVNLSFRRSQFAKLESDVASQRFRNYIARRRRRNPFDNANDLFRKVTIVSRPLHKRVHLYATRYHLEGACICQFVTLSKSLCKLKADFPWELLEIKLYVADSKGFLNTPTSFGNNQYC